MARPKKDSHAFSMKMSAEVYERLEKYCEEKGQTKTTAVERILNEAFDKEKIPTASSTK